MTIALLLYKSKDTTNNRHMEKLLPQYQYDRLQKVRNAAARVTCLIPKFEHISPLLKWLHWLPIKYRVECKIALLVFKEFPAWIWSNVYQEAN